MNTVQALLFAIHREANQPVRLMEVCGGHTHAIRKFGIPGLLPDTVSLLSGPGCPVCVTHTGFIDQAIHLAQNYPVIITTFGDLIRVPGSGQSLETARAGGADIRIVLSPLQALSLAETERSKQVVFLGIGFETTAPSVAATILTALERRIENFSVLSAHKIMPPAMAALVNHQPNLDGFICPGHVSTITGSGIYEFLSRDHGIPCVISGFEAPDILESILLLIRQINNHQPKVEIQYKRAVKPEGNMKALEIMHEVFVLHDDWWRGMGIIPNSGLVPGGRYAGFDTLQRFSLPEFPDTDNRGCRCGDILRGLITPPECSLYGKTCTPESPAGACMVSSEGTCQAFYRYQN
ncbi:MAG: hydrogenase formation protein HypD [Porphyromonadaceae bacterium]|nr:MAG: hydrogenase formation protein HypD [Porphyromonadaceae bacterium]